MADVINVPYGEELNNKPDGMSALHADADMRCEMLLSQDEERKNMSIHIALETLLSRMESKEKEIIEAVTSKKSWRSEVVGIVAGEIVRVVSGDMLVENYSQRAKAEQDVLLYDGKFWRPLGRQKFYDFVNKCAKQIGLPDNLCSMHSFMNSVYENVAFLVAHVAEPKFEKNVQCINLLNGTLEIREGKLFVLRSHTREDYFMYCLPYEYDAEAECPLWHRFLDQMLPDKDVQKVLAEYIGYCLTSHIKGEKMLVFHGFGSNGKSVVLDIIEKLFGRDNVSNVSLCDLTDDPERRAMIENKLLNVSHESDKELNAAVLKQLVSNEPVVVRELYKGPHTMYNYAKLITSFNVMPKAEVTYGFYRRFLVIPFEVTIKEGEADLNLVQKLATELPGILNWVLEGLARFMDQGTFTQSEVCSKALAKYMLMSDSVRLFLKECCVQDDASPTNGTTLYQGYRSYCIADSLKFLGKQKFYDRLESLGIAFTESHRTKLFNIRIVKE